MIELIAGFVILAAFLIAFIHNPDERPKMQNIPLPRYRVRMVDIALAILGAAAVLSCLLFMIVTGAFAHDHWIRNGKYLDPTTGTHCCNEHDCKVIEQPELGLYHFNGSGSITTPDGATFLPSQIHNSEDEHWYRCANRCLFRPQQV